MKSLLSLAAMSAVMAISADAADWPRWRGPNANGISAETGWQAPAEGPKQLWKVKVGTGFSSMVVSDGKLYALGNAQDTDTVSCLDAKTGKELWRYSYPCKLDPNLYEGGPNATPTVDGGHVYTFSKEGLVNCLDAAKGTLVWSKNLAQEFKAEVPQWGFSGSALVVGDVCILNVGAAGVGLDKKTGKTLWSSGSDKAGYATPVPFGKAVLVFGGENLVAVQPQDGKELWRFPWKTSYEVNAADPVISGNKIFISSGYNRGGSVIDVTDGKPKPLWDNKNMRNHFNSSVLLDGHLYGLDEKQLRCLAFDTGEIKWSDPAAGKGSLIASDGKLIVLGERGELMIAPATPTGFKPISRAQVLGGKCWTAPVLANGLIYCRNAVGDLVCLDVRGK